MKFYVIIHSHKDTRSDAPLFFNLNDGWVDLASATVFHPNDRYNYNLPMEAWGWLELPSTLWEEFQGIQYESDAKAAALEDQDVF